MTTPTNTITDKREQAALLQLARDAIAYGLDHGKPPSVHLTECPESFRVVRATFVTLEKRGLLRGCIGTLEALRPLAEDVVQHAFSAAFHDPRFAPLERAEWEDVDIHLSILSPPEPMIIQSEADLIGQLRPGVDGLILQEGAQRATFLPSVWSDLQNPQDFVQYLKRKAGFAPAYWSPDLQALRYTAQYITE